MNYQAPVYYAPPPQTVGTITITVPKILNCNRWKSTNIYGFWNLNDYTISGVTISGQFSCTNDILVNNTYILQTIITLTSLINYFNYKPIIYGTLSISGLICYNNLSVSGSIY